jgi:hypothetical protein
LPNTVNSTSKKNKLKINREITRPKNVPPGLVRWGQEEYQGLNNSLGVNKRDNDGCDQNYISGPQESRYGLSYKIRLNKECNKANQAAVEVNDRKKILNYVLDQLEAQNQQLKIENSRDAKGD